MPDRVITKIAKPTQHASIKNFTYSLGEVYRESGETLDIKTLRYGMGRPVWWQHPILVHGAESGEYYHGRPGTFSRSDARYGWGVLVCVYDSVSSHGTSAILVAPEVPVIEIGKPWDPINEEVDEVIIQNDFHITTGNDPLDAGIAGMALEKTMSTVEEFTRRALGEHPWGLGTNFLKAMIELDSASVGGLR